MAKKQAPKEIKSNVTIENARIGFRNFEGKESTYNRKGDRNFVIFLEEPIAGILANDGWNVKMLPPREEGDDPQPYLPVGLRFDFFPPAITLITSGGSEELDEDTVKLLDTAEFEKIDLIVRPYNWSMPSGKHGVKAMLKTMFATIVEDELTKKYRNVLGFNPGDDDKPPWED